MCPPSGCTHIDNCFAMNSFGVDGLAINSFGWLVLY